MFKGGFEVAVHSGAIDIMQPPHDQWPTTTTTTSDYSDVDAFPVGVNSVPSYSKPTNVNENPDLPQWIEHVTKQLLEAQHAPTTMASENNVVPALLGELTRPGKSVLRNYDDKAGNQQQWCDDDDDGDQGLGHDRHARNFSEETTDRSLSLSSSMAAAGGDDMSLNLMTLLMECAVAISVDNISEAHKMLLELTQMSTPYSPSCAERIVAYFSKAMASRVVNSWIGICTPLISHKTLHSAFQVFNNISPFIKFAHFTSNQSILEAFHRRDRVHIVDLDIMQGLQWPALFHILATRIEGPPHVRMTGMGTSMELLSETGKNLSNFARRLGMSFEFHPIARKFGDIDVAMLQLRRGETVAVHWLQHSMYDATGPDWKTMRLLQEISPRVVTLVEQDIAHGGCSFLDRFVGSLHYYSTIFDSLGAYFKGDNPSRHQVEHDLLYKEINNVLAIGGPARSGEDKFRHWRNELMKNGFVQVGMSTNSMAQAQLILNMYPPGHGYSLVQGDGMLRLGWKDTSLYSVSAWTSPHSR